MKKLKRFFCIALSAWLLFALAVPASAREEEYTYTVRFFAGKQGSFGGGEVMVFEGLRYGDRINFYQNAVTLNDNSKYYIRGIRESGKDNSVSTQTSSFRVTGDMDYVVAYGILGDATSYTINYVDSEGNTLAPSETYYGNVGDRPVVAYIYIEGWAPEAYNMTQTLKKDPAENVFNFVYTRALEVPAAGPTEDGGIVVIPGPDGPGTPGEGGNAPDDGTVPDDAGNEPDEQEIPDEETPTGNGPDEERDLDEDETPTGNFLALAADARLLGIPVPVIIIAVCGTVGVAGYFLLLKKRKKKEVEA